LLSYRKIAPSTSQFSLCALPKLNEATNYANRANQMIVIRDIRALGEGYWDNFVINNPNGTIFHTSNWLRVMEQYQSNVIERLGIFDENVLIGVVPLCIKRYWTMRIAGSPLIVEDTPYLGIVTQNKLFPAALKALDRYAKEKHISFLRLLQSQYIPNIENFSNTSLIRKHTHILELSKGLDFIWNNMEGRCRTAIRKASKIGVEVETEKSKDCIDTYYHILDQLYSQQNMQTPNSKCFYYSLWDTFWPRNLILLTARYNGVVIAGAFIVRDRQTFYYINGASLTEGKNSNAGNLIQWKAIEIAVADGAQRYDFVGSDIERLSNFKKSFGGSLTAYSCLEIPYTSSAAFFRARYPKFKRIYGIMKTRLLRKSQVSETDKAGSSKEQCS
jgi:lipid II:glycine glycyltransferase (peptidoglycan interpeptide bridge formation enzyme)